MTNALINQNGAISIWYRHIILVTKNTLSAIASITRYVFESDLRTFAVALSAISVNEAAYTQVKAYELRSFRIKYPTTGAKSNLVDDIMLGIMLGF